MDPQQITDAKKFWDRIDWILMDKILTLKEEKAKKENGRAN